MNRLALGSAETGRPPMFTGDIAQREHLLSVYDNEAEFLKLLESFVVMGLEAAEGIVVIGTSGHLDALHDRLKLKGVGVAAAQIRDQYIPVDADEMTAEIIVDGRPEHDRLEQWVGHLIARASGNGRPVRIFGEMVALL